MSVIGFVLSVLKRKAVTDQEARNNFIDLIWDYISNIQTIESIEVGSNKQSYQHKVFYDKLKVLAERYNSIGDEAVADSKIEDFLNGLQNNIREYLYNGVESELYEIRKNHYSKLAFSKSNPHDSPAFKQAKNEMFKKLDDYSELG